MTLNDVAAVSVSDECAEKRTLGGSEDTPPPEEAEALPWTEGGYCIDSHGIGRGVLVCGTVGCLAKNADLSFAYLPAVFRQRLERDCRVTGTWCLVPGNWCQAGVRC